MISRARPGTTSAATAVRSQVDTGAVAPSVDVTIVSGGATTDWTDTAIAPGFHVHHIGPLAPGAKVTLTVAAAMARVRWCETVCC